MGPADDLKAGVKSLYEGSPVGQIFTTMDSMGKKLKDVGEKGLATAKRMLPQTPKRRLSDIQLPSRRASGRR